MVIIVVRVAELKMNLAYFLKNMVLKGITEILRQNFIIQEELHDNAQAVLQQEKYVKC